jgi:S-adenosylmethionine:tRNA ribosyltransferase-isomerase
MHNNQHLYQITAYDYALPETLIARYPKASRTDSRLLVHRPLLPPAHHQFSELSLLLKSDDLLVLNDTKVIPARLQAKKASGGVMEILFERLLDAHTCLAQVKASKPLKAEQYFLIAETVPVKVIGREDQFYCLQLDTGMEWLRILDEFGEIPIPPYFQRQGEMLDRTRYQTVYAQTPGAVAAPTAGLHFDNSLLQTLTQKGIEVATLTLHVGAGTFSPVRVEDIREHRMHVEYYELSEHTWKMIQQAKQTGRRVIAVGTTTLRVLESFVRSPQPFYQSHYQGSTDIFIYPGFNFQICDSLITNFHLPKSTLLMLVAAFIGLEEMHELYATAIAQAYRFYSYGDAMLLQCSQAQ